MVKIICSSNSEVITMINIINSAINSKDSNGIKDLSIDINVKSEV